MDIFTKGEYLIKYWRMSLEAELRAEEQRLLQESYEERAELREKLVLQSHKILEAAESVQSLSLSAVELLNVLREIKDAVSNPIETQPAESELKLDEEQKNWIVELLLADGIINTAMLVDPHSRLIREWLKRHVNEDCELYLQLLAVNTDSITLGDLVADLRFEVSSRQLNSVLSTIQKAKEVKIVPEENCILPILLDIELSAKTVKFGLSFTKEDLDRVVSRIESQMANDIAQSIQNCTDNVTLIEVLLRADKEFETIRQELIEHINTQIDSIESLEDVIRLVASMPSKYQTACSDKVIYRLRMSTEDLSIDPEVIKDAKIRGELIKRRVAKFENELLKQIDTDPIKVLFEARVPNDYNISTDSQLWTRIQSSILEEDLLSMRLLLAPFIPKTIENVKSPKQLRFDMLPSPDSIPAISKIRVKKTDVAVSATIPSPTSPALSIPANSTPQPKNIIDPLKALKKILPY